MRFRVLAVVACSLVALLAPLGSHGRAGAGDTWSGTWARAEVAGNLILVQSGSSVTGRYTWNDGSGRVSGRVSAATFTGTFDETHYQGTFVLKLSGKKFSGSYTGRNKDSGGPISGPFNGTCIAGACRGNGAAATGAGTPKAKVKRLQRDLHKLGLYTGPVDGESSATTEAALKRFQRSVGLPADGDCEPRCEAALRKALTFVDPSLPPGSAPAAPRPVTQLQRALGQLGFYSGPLTGDYDGRTTAAVKSFQRDVGIAADGKCTVRCQLAVVRALNTRR